MKTGQELLNIFGNNITTLRKRRKLTQEQLAEKAGVSPDTISAIEAGDTFAQADTLVRLAHVLQSEVYTLLMPGAAFPVGQAELAASFSEALKDVVSEFGGDYFQNKKKKAPRIKY